jgi:hypothetical protein
VDGQWGNATVNKEVPMSLSLGLQQDLVRQVPAHLQRAFGVARPARRTGATGGAVS